MGEFSMDIDDPFVSRDADVDRAQRVGMSLSSLCVTDTFLSRIVGLLGPKACNVHTSDKNHSSDDV